MLKIKRKPHHKVIHHSGRTLRKLRKLAIAVVMLGVLLGAAAFILSYLNSENSKPVQEITITPKPKPKGPTQTPPNAPVGVAVSYITDTVKRGDNASLTIHTNTDVKCTITVVYDAYDMDKNKLVTAHDSGLVTRNADEYGLVNWSWTVAPNAPLGKATATALCANLKHSGMYIGDIVVK